jgi:hypothetical protein
LPITNPEATSSAANSLSSAAFEAAGAEVTFGVEVSDDGLDGGAAAEFALDDTEDAGLLAGDEDAMGILRAVAAVSFVDIARSIRQPVSVSVRKVTVVWVSGALACSTDRPPVGQAIVGDDGDRHAELVRCGGLAFAEPWASLKQQLKHFTCNHFLWTDHSP